MKAIYKYSLNGELRLTEGYEILTVQTQDGVPFIWIKVDVDKAPTVCVQFNVFGTGEPLLEDTGTYVGTYQELQGQLIWHVFVTEKKNG